jgi:hypothetical protein
MKTMIALLVFGACGSARTVSAPTEQTSNVQPSSPLDRELSRMQELDYRSPMQPRWTDDEKSERREFLKSECEQSPLACLRSSSPAADRAYIHLHCRAGDRFSCRWHEWWEGLNGTTGDLRSVPYPFTLPDAELRRGCAAGLHAECDLLLRTNDVANVRHGAENNCRFAKRDCLAGSESYMEAEPREPLRARFLAELDCQRDDLNSCLWLSLAYRSGALSEPAVGRGDELHRYVCKHRNSQFCAEIDTKCNARREALLAPGVCEPPRPPPIRR